MSDHAAIPPKKSWSEPALLKTIPNPAKALCYWITINNPEVTFMGAKEQPDFAHVKIEYVPADLVIELKSLKKYFHDLRNRLLSYERFISVIFADIVAIYHPRHIKITAVFNPRGGMTTTVIVDSAQQA